MKLMKPHEMAWSDWNQTYVRAVTDWAEVVSTLREAEQQKEPPSMVEIYDKSTGRSLGMGLGREQTVLTYQDSLDPPYFISQGDSRKEGIDWFCYGQEQTEYLASNLVPVSAIEPTLMAFVQGASRPKTVDWEQL